MDDDQISPDVWQRLKELIERNKTFTITTHVNPDVDGIGSELALYEFLRQRGKDVRIINNNDIPKVYTFLAKATDIFTTFSSGVEAWITQCDVIFILDISTFERLGAIEACVRNSSAVKICIDHHPGNYCVAELNLIQESACATAEIIFELFTNLGGTLTKEIAEALYVAILTDTASFSNHHTVPQSHLIAAELIRYGVNPADVYQKIYESFSWRRFELLKKSLGTLRSECGGKLAWMKIDETIVKESGALREEIDGFVDFPLSINGVELAILFLEVPGRGTKISLRSREKVDVHAFAQEFGGGGHHHAAGIRWFGIDLNDAIHRVLEKARELF